MTKKTTDKKLLADRMYILEYKGITAYGRGAGFGKAFTVLAGSYAVADCATGYETDPTNASKRWRDQLVENGVLDIVDGELLKRRRLAHDVTFTSPSMAASVMCGNYMDGNTAWQEQ